MGGDLPLIEVESANGSVYGMTPSDHPDLGFPFILGTMVANNDTSVEFGHISRFAKFCFDNDTGIRRNKTELYNAGDLLSDIRRSEAFRVANHTASNPNDTGNA